MRWTFISADAPQAPIKRWGQLHDRVGGIVLTNQHAVACALAHFTTQPVIFAFLEDAGQDVAATLVRNCGRGQVEVFCPAQLPVALMLCDSRVTDATAFSTLAKQTSRFTLGLKFSAFDPHCIADPQFGAHALVASQYETPHIDIDGSLEAYMEARSTKFRSDLRRRAKKAETEVGGIRFEISSGDVAASVRQYAQLESAGWKGSAGTALAPENAQEAFYVEWLDRLAPHAQPLFLSLWIGGKLAAMRIAIAGDDTLYMLKVSHDEQLRAYSPGALMLQNVLAAVFAGQINAKRIEFYGKVGDVHRPWMTGSREIFHGSIYRNGWLPRIRALIGRKPVVDAE